MPSIPTINLRGKKSVKKAHNIDAMIPFPTAISFSNFLISKYGIPGKTGNSPLFLAKRHKQYHLPHLLPVRLLHHVDYFPRLFPLLLELTGTKSYDSSFPVPSQMKVPQSCTSPGRPLHLGPHERPSLKHWRPWIDPRKSLLCCFILQTAEGKHKYKDAQNDDLVAYHEFDIVGIDIWRIRHHQRRRICDNISDIEYGPYYLVVVGLDEKKVMENREFFGWIQTVCSINIHSPFDQPR